MISTVALGLDHPECVAIGLDGMLYAGGEGGQIYRIDPGSGAVQTIGLTGGFVLGIALDAHGNVYACDTGLCAVVRIAPDGSVVVISRGIRGRPMLTPNYPVFDAVGTLYVSDSGHWAGGGGCIYRIATDGSVEVWSQAAPHFTNGLALAPDGSALYIAESTLPGITRIPILPDGSAGDAEIVALMPGTVPDGLAFDVTGRLYIGCYRPDRIYTRETDGQMLIFADDYQGTTLAAPTNLAFGGTSMTDLYIASLGRWHVGRITAPDSGQRLHYPTALIPSEEP